jgi:hypothetical protein
MVSEDAALFGVDWAFFVLYCSIVHWIVATFECGTPKEFVGA